MLNIVHSRLSSVFIAFCFAGEILFVLIQCQVFLFVIKWESDTLEVVAEW